MKFNAWYLLVITITFNNNGINIHLQHGGQLFNFCLLELKTISVHIMLII